MCWNDIRGDTRNVHTTHVTMIFDCFVVVVVLYKEQVKPVGVGVL